MRLTAAFVHDAWMVRTGKRASALAGLLEAGGLPPDVSKTGAPRLTDLDVSKTGAPRLTDLDAATACEVLDLYKDL